MNECESNEWCRDFRYESTYKEPHQTKDQFVCMIFLTEYNIYRSASRSKEVTSMCAFDDTTCIGCVYYCGYVEYDEG